MTFICWGWYQRPLPAPCMGLASFPASEGSRFPVLHRGRVLWASTGLLQRPSTMTNKYTQARLPRPCCPRWCVLRGCWGFLRSVQAVTVAGHPLRRSCCRGAVLLLSVILLGSCRPVDQHKRGFRCCVQGMGHKSRTLNRHHVYIVRYMTNILSSHFA